MSNISITEAGNAVVVIDEDDSLSIIQIAEQGPSGTNGANGTNGTNGTNGINGTNLVFVSSNDTTGAYLDTKLVAGTGITLTENNDGGNETLTIDAASGSPFTDLEFSLNLSRTTATLNGTATDGHVNLGSGTSITGFTGQAFDYISIGGGLDNSAISVYDVVAGGQGNAASQAHSCILGGRNNTAGNTYAVCVGGNACNASGIGAFIGSGQTNIASGTRSVSVGGLDNDATGIESAILGGENNIASSNYASIVGGIWGRGAGTYSTVLGGKGNKASHTHSIAGGGGSDTRANYDFVLGATDTITPAVANNTIRLQATGGNIKIDGAVTSPEADYAEMFEWADGNPNDDDRVGTFVSLVNGKLVADGSNIIGIISGAPSIVGNGAPNNWAKMYVKDKYKRQIKVSYDVISWTDEQDIEHSVFEDASGTQYDEYPQPTNVGGTSSQKIPANNSTRRKIKTPMINPEFDITKEYIPRADRKEWDAVGLLGQIVVNTSEIITGTHIDVKRDGSVTNGTEYQVIEVISDSLVLVFFK